MYGFHKQLIFFVIIFFISKNFLLAGQKNKHGAFVASHTCAASNNAKVKSQNKSMYFFTFQFSLLISKVPDDEVSDTTKTPFVFWLTDKNMLFQMLLFSTSHFSTAYLGF